MAVDHHHPPHIFLDDTWYCITASTYGQRRLLHPLGHKGLLRDTMHALLAEFGMQLTAWVILDNHYHILAKSRRGTALPRFFGRLHGSTSFQLNGLDQARGRQVWRNYWDTCIRSEADYWTRFNYIHHNPVKHGYVQRSEDWPFCSYNHYLQQKGEEWLDDLLLKYPITDFSDARDVF